jgi:hypothetical protein
MEIAMATAVFDTMVGNQLFGDRALSPQQYGEKRRLKQQAGMVAPLQQQLSTLKAQLGFAQEDAFLEKLKNDATSAVLKLALEALQRADPNSPLLNEEHRKNIKRQRLSEMCQANGYVFHADTGKVDLKFKRN